jgi:hypothetical protein
MPKSWSHFLKIIPKIELKEAFSLTKYAPNFKVQVATDIYFYLAKVDCALFALNLWYW